MSAETLSKLAKSLGVRLSGDPELLITRVAPFDVAVQGDITLAADIGYLARINESRASAFIIPEKLPVGINGDDALDQSRNYLIAAQPKLAFARAVRLLHDKLRIATGASPEASIGANTTIGAAPSIHARATIGRDCRIGARVTIHAGVVIGDEVVIGDDTTVHANVSVYDETEIGRGVIIHSGAVIGADGFGFVPDEQGHHYKILQIGKVIIEDDVEIGANCCIDRAAFGATVLRRGVKLDNLIQVAHNCALGEDTVVAAQVGFSGSTTVGHHVVVAGQAATNQHVTIGDKVIVGGQAGVTKDVASGKFVAGTPAQEHTRWKRAQALVNRLPELFERLKKIENKLSQKD